MRKQLRNVILTLGVLCLSACGPKHDPIAFQKYAQSIPVLKLPLTFVNMVPSESSDYRDPDTTLTRQFTPPTMRLLGRVFTHLGFVSILYTRETRARFLLLYTFTLDGTPIDTAFISGAIFVRAGIRGTSTTNIAEDGSITIRDTIFSVPRDSIGKFEPGTEAVSARTRVCRLLATGEIVEVDSLYRQSPD